MYLFFDTETSGLAKNYSAPIDKIDNWPRIVQIAWKLYDKDGINIDTQSFIVKPDGFKIDEASIKIHRITEERAYKEGVDLLYALEEFEKVVKRSKYLIAHNIPFDEKVTGCELFRLNKKNFINDCIHVDTMRTTIEYCAIPSKRGGYKFPTLSELYKKIFNDYFEEAHDALVDVTALAKCFFALQKLGVLGYTEQEQQETKVSEDIFNKIINNDNIENQNDNKPLLNLCIHTYHSILEGAGSAIDYIKKAKIYNQKSLAITDISTLSGSFDFYQKCKSLEIKPIIGMELYVNDKIGIIENGKAQGESYKIRLYVKNDVGFKNLSKILYYANTEGYYMVGRACSKWIYENKEGLIITTGSIEGKVSQLLQKGKNKEAEEYVKELVDNFGVENLYADIQLTSNAQQKSYNNFMIVSANKFNFKTVLSNNTFFVDKNDKEIQDVVAAIKQRTSVDQAKLKENEDCYLFSSNDFYFFNKKYGFNYPDKFLELCFQNSLEIAEKCNFEFDTKTEKYPKYEPTQDVIDYFGTNDTELIIYKLAFAKLKQKLKALEKNNLIVLDDNTIKKYSNQLKYELDIIKDKKMLDYFMVNWEIIRDYTNHGHMIGIARGCFIENNKVLMADKTLKNIQDISIEELVLDAFGDVKRVMDTFQYDIEENIIELSFKDGRTITCTLEHEILTNNRGWIQAQYLTEEDDISEICIN